jgi:nucleoside-diphosphate-sugar epimerase
MIIGNGLLGSAFKRDGFGSLADLTIFASGVSYSGEVRQEEYQRELDLLSQVMMRDSYIVYFSTCSVFDNSLSSSVYVKHKIEIENSLRERGRSLVIRLPQVVGVGGNKNNLINYLIFKILNGEKFDLWFNASRSLIDVDDVVFFTKKFVDHFFPHCAQINLAAPGRISIIEIVRIIEECVGKKANYNILERGGEYVIDVNQVSQVFDEYLIKFHPEYFRELIWKYCGACVRGIL